MPYISPIKLPDDKNAPLPPYEKAVRRYLESQLLQHRAQVDEFILTDFEGKPPREIHLTFGAPRWQMDHMGGVIAKLYSERGQATPDMADRAKHTIDDFIKDVRQEGWTHIIQQADTTVVFTEAIGDMSHIANPKHMLNKTISFSFNDGFASLDGRGISIEHKNLLKHSLPNAVAWLDSAKEVENDGILNFHPTIELSTENNVGIYPTRTLFVGGEMLARITDEDNRKDILRHERGHYVNGDLDAGSDHNRVLNGLLGAADRVTTRLQETLDHIKDPKDIRSNDHEKDLRNIEKFGDALSSTMQQFVPLAEKIRAYEWQDDLSALSIAADMNNPSSIVQHLLKVEKLDMKPLESAITDIMSHVKSDPYKISAEQRMAAFRDPDWKDVQLDELSAALQKQYDRITPEQKEAHRVVDEVYQNLHKACEYAADIHAAQHSENPQHLHKVFEKFMELFGESTGRTHPHSRERAQSAKHFGDRVLHQRKQAAEEAEKGAAR